jgi:hypothetical protein
VRTVELLLDAGLDAGIRRLWDDLHAAGLPSLATHRHPTNRPHVTLATAASPAALPGIGGLGLPVPAVLGPARMLGRALVREVIRTPGLDRLQARVWAAVGAVNPLHAPDRWIPHVSLALNVPEPLRPVALDRAADLPPAYGEFVAARSYDTGTRTVTGL